MRLGKPYKHKIFFMTEVPECFYRVSAKALILNETKDKFLICKEDNGKWELPGGGLDFGTTPQEDIPREISEEMGLKTTSVANNPCYFFTFKFERPLISHGANILYETTVEDLDFTPSDECVEIAFVNKETMGDRQPFSAVEQLLEVFDPENHK